MGVLFWFYLAGVLNERLLFFNSLYQLSYFE